MDRYYAFSVNSFVDLTKDKDSHIRESGGVLRSVAKRMSGMGSALKKSEIDMLLRSASIENPNTSSKIKFSVDEALNSMAHLKEDDFCLCPFVFDFKDATEHAVTLVFTKDNIHVFDTGPQDKKGEKMSIIKGIIKESIKNIGEKDYNGILINNKALQHKKGCAFYMFYFMMEASKYKNFSSLSESIKSGEIQCDIASKMSNITRTIQYDSTMDGKELGSKLDPYKYLPKFIELKSFQICQSGYCRVQFDGDKDYAFLSTRMKQTRYINKGDIIKSMGGGITTITKSSCQDSELKKLYRQCELEKSELKKYLLEKLREQSLKEEESDQICEKLLSVIEEKYKYKKAVIEEQLNYFKQNTDDFKQNTDDIKKKHEIENKLFSLYKKYINYIQEVYNNNEENSIVCDVLKNKIPTSERLSFEENLLKKHHEYELKFANELKSIKELSGRREVENTAIKLLEEEKIAFYSRIIQYENNFAEYEITKDEKNLLKMEDFHIDDFNKVEKYLKSRRLVKTEQRSATGKKPTMISCPTGAISALPTGQRNVLAKRPILGPHTRQQNVLAKRPILGPHTRQENVSVKILIPRLPTR